MIAVGDTLPNLTVKTWADGPVDLNIADQVAGKTVVIFGVPAAYTPTCSEQHVPGFVERAEALKAAGAEAIYCLSVNDPFVMRAWLRDLGAETKIVPAADWDAAMVKSMGLVNDLSVVGLGVRAKRFMMILRDGKVSHIGVEEGPGEHSVSSAVEALKILQA